MERWRGNIGNEEADKVSKEACDIGSDVHHYCELINKGEWKEPPESIKDLVCLYKEWVDATVKEFVAVEEVLWSDKYWYAGRMDFACILKGDRTLATVCDLKTSKGFYKEMGLQLDAYKYAADEMGLFRSKRRMIVRLDKINRKLETKEYSNVNDFRMFLYALSLHSYFEGGKKGDVVRIS